jgi:ABC-type antimicrobial peptide transport system permease subunit
MKILLKYRHIIREYSVLALSNLWAFKLRSSLTMLGILIGIASFTVLLMIGESNKAKIQQEIEKVGPNTIQIFPGITKNQSLMVTDQPFKYLPWISHTGLESTQFENIDAGTSRIYCKILGITKDYFKIRPAPQIIQGRFFSDLELSHGLPVCFIDQVCFNQYFKTQSQKHPSLYIRGIRFAVVGIFGTEQEKDPFYEPIIYLPYQSAGRIFSKGSQTNVILRLNNLKQLEKKLNQIKISLGFTFPNSESIKVISAQEMIAFSKKLSVQVAVFVFSISILLLTVGGVGIMNISLVSITERTKEIGIRRALGAAVHSIFFQFLCETVLLSLIAGLGGVLLGIGIGWSMVTHSKLPFVFPIQPASLGILLSILTGILSGLYPSIRAAKMNPIEALKYE